MTGTVIDRFEVKDRVALEYGAAGVVVIFRHEQNSGAPASGDAVLLVRPDGWLFRGNAEDVRAEPSASATGLFLRGLRLEDVPIGSSLRWGAEVHLLKDAVA